MRTPKQQNLLNRRITTIAAISLGITSLWVITGCAGSSAGQGTVGSGAGTQTQQAATPSIAAAPQQNGAQLVSLTDSTTSATIYYTTDGSTPTTASPQYIAPFLIASNVKLNAIAILAGETNSAVATQSFAPNIPSGTLVWSDEFTNTTTANAEPNPSIWTYDTGGGGFGNNELENYCDYASSVSPCVTASPNVYVGTDGYLHIVAEQPSTGVYTSARLKSQGLFSFQYGRLEFRAKVPEAQGFWPAAWLMGNNIATVNWPACGEMDVMERVNAATTPDFNVGSVHGPGFTGIPLGTTYNFPSGQTASTWHTYGMIWKPGSVSYYVDDPSNIYATYTPSSLNSLPNSAWPFDGGQSNFLLINLAVGGNYPGAPTASTPFPSEMLIDYVRLYTN